MTITPASIRAWLDEQAIPYRHVVLAPTHTSQESADARGEPLEIGAKALVLKIDRRDGARHLVAVLSAATKLDSAAIRTRENARSVRFATREELLELTGLVPGSVPPFGAPLLPMDLVVDEHLARLPRVAFNCASLTESLVMTTADYLRAARPRAVFSLAHTIVGG